jgi:thioredoxin-related protein
MRKLKLLTLLTMICGGAFAQGINFEQSLSWQQVKEKAKAENKYIFVDCFTTWCGPCKMMDRDVYPRQNVGSFMNEHFISVKIQMDTVKSDSETIKKRYSEANDMKNKYNITAYPSYLYFSPEGRLLHKFIGLLRDSDFIKLGSNALNPDRQYCVLLEEYQNVGIKYSKMPYLAKTAKEIGDRELAVEIAKDYKLNFLDKLDDKETLNKKQLDFIGEFYSLISSKDKVFYFCYNYPDKVDSIKEYMVGNGGGWAKFQVEQTVIREEITPYVGKSKEIIPDWNKIRSSINKKYKKIDSKLMVLDAQIDFYKEVNDWIKFADFRSEKMLLSPPKTGGMMGDALFLNNDAWDVFINCKDKGALKKALSWIERAIALQATDPSFSYFDTKANLLYKLGRRKEALQIEQIAINLDKMAALKHKREPQKEFQETLNKMLKNLPTWDQQ